MPKGRNWSKDKDEKVTETRILGSLLYKVLYDCLGMPIYLAVHFLAARENYSTSIVSYGAQDNSLI